MIMMSNNYNRLIVCLYLLVLLLLSIVSSFAAAQPRNGPSPPTMTEDAKTQNFKPSMLVVIIVLITAFFFMGFFSIYLRQCVSENSTGIGGSIRRQTIGLRSRRIQKGLDSELINTFPIFLYSEVKGLKIGKGTLECAVCLNEFEDDETLRLLPKCDHVFHPECIDAWLAAHTTCPVCRCDLNVVVLSGVSGREEEEAAVVPVSEEDDDDHQERNIQSPEISTESQEQVLIRVNYRDDDEDEEINNKQSEISIPDVINPLQNPIQNRSKSMKPRTSSKFPRSHSTGHSLVQPGDNVERFTLRLPEDVRKQIVADVQLNRAGSYADFQTRQKSVSGSSSGGSRLQGLRGGSVGSGAGRSGKYFHFGRLDRAAKSDNWGFKLTIPFFTRNPSVRSPKKSDGSVKSAFDNGVGAKSGGGDAGSGTTNEHNQTNSTAAAPRPPV